MSEAITVANEVTLDHWELGKQFAEWDNLQQFEFLLGVKDGLDLLGGSGPFQVHYIWEAARAAGDEVQLSALAGLLHEYFQESDA